MFAAILSAIALCICSVLIGNGFSPVFAVMKETRRSRIPLFCIVFFFAIKLAYDSACGVLAFTLVQYPAWALCYLVAKRSAILSATLFFILSNTICFFQMNGSIPEFTTYPATFAGYLECMAAGVPYYLRSLAATIVWDAAILWLIRHSPAPLRLYFPMSVEVGELGTGNGERGS